MKPEPIAPDLAIGGLVFQTWVAGRLVLEDRISVPTAIAEDEIDEYIDQLAHRAGEAAANAMRRAGAASAELRCFDGDTGAWVGTRVIASTAGGTIN